MVSCIDKKIKDSKIFHWSLMKKLWEKKNWRSDHLKAKL